VFAGVGERTREGNDLYREMIESGVIKLGDKQVILLHIFYLALNMKAAVLWRIDICGRVKASVLLSTVKWMSPQVLVLVLGWLVWLLLNISVMLKDKMCFCLSTTFSVSPR
jgi:hypothetical protein